MMYELLGQLWIVSGASAQSIGLDIAQNQKDWGEGSRMERR